MITFVETKNIIIQILQLTEPNEKFLEESELMGAIAEFDSMAVVSILTAIEEQYDIEIDDDEITGEIFETFGTLHQFLVDKMT